VYQGLRVLKWGLYPGYPSSLAGPPGSSGEQVLSSLALDVAESSLAVGVVRAQQQLQSTSSLAATPRRQQLASRQPPTAAAATETAAAEGPTLVATLEIHNVCLNK